MAQWPCGAASDNEVVVTPSLALTAALLAWKAEIESTGGIPLFVAEAHFEPESHQFSLPADTAGRGLFASYLRQEDFLREFILMDATMIYHRAPGQQAFLVLLNGARRQHWAPHQEAVLAHEFGHAWIKAQGFPTPLFAPGPFPCLSVHTGDITQHVLIRRELDRRGIPFRPFWLAGLERSIPVLETAAPPPEPDRCARARLAAEWADVRLGLLPGQWPLQPRYEAAVRKYMPELVSTVDAIVAYVSAHDMASRDQHRDALRFVFDRLKDLVYQRAKEFRVYGTLKRNPRVS